MCTSGVWKRAVTNGRLTVAPCALLPPLERAVLACAELVWAVLVRAALVRDRAEVDRAEVERVERVDPVRERADEDLALVLVERRAVLPPEVPVWRVPDFLAALEREVACLVPLPLLLLPAPALPRVCPDFLAVEPPRRVLDCLVFLELVVVAIRTPFAGTRSPQAYERVNGR